jgi:O-antigen/teichoic acid export membrane protein
MNGRTPDLERFAAGAGIGLIGRFAGRFISVAAGIVIARVLGPAAFGVYAVGWTLFRLVELVTPLGFDIGVIKYGVGFLDNDNRAVKGVIVYSLWGSVLFSLCLGVCAYLLSPWLADSIFMKPALKDVIRLYSCALPLSGLVGVLSATSRLTRNMLYSVAVQDAGEPLLALVILGLFWLNGLNLVRVVFSDLISYGLVTLLAIGIIRTLFPFVFERRTVPTPPGKGFYSYSLSSALFLLLGTLVFWIDRLFVGSLLSASQAGIYQSAVQISVVFAVVISGFNRISTPVFSSLYHENNLGQLEEMYRIGTKWMVYISMPVLLVLLLTSRDILGLIYGEAFSAGGVAFVILLMGQIVNLATGSVGALLLVGGFQRALVLLSGLVLGINAAMCFFLIPRLGIFGAAVANSLSVALLNLSALVIVKIKMKIWPYDRRYIKVFLACLAASLVAAFVKHFIDFRGFPGVIMVAIIVFAVFGLVLAVVHLDAEDRALVRLITKR